MQRQYNDAIAIEQIDERESTYDDILFPDLFLQFLQLVLKLT